MDTATKQRYRRTPHIALDFDKTLFTHESSWGISKIGEPIAEMIENVKRWINKGHRITIFTARACPWGPRGEDRANDVENQKLEIQDALEKAGLPRFEVTSEKRPSYTHIIDDRAWNVKMNTGEIQHNEEYMGL
jgi:hypothetical protein